MTLTERLAALGLGFPPATRNPASLPISARACSPTPALGQAPCPSRAPASSQWEQVGQLPNVKGWCLPSRHPGAGDWQCGPHFPTERPWTRDPGCRRLFSRLCIRTANSGLPGLLGAESPGDSQALSQQERRPVFVILLRGKSCRARDGRVSVVTYVPFPGPARPPLTPVLACELPPPSQWEKDQAPSGRCSTSCPHPTRPSSPAPHPPTPGTCLPEPCLLGPLE